MQNNPYVGPRPFEQRHASSFFGRDEEIQILAGLTRARRAVLFYAQSGAGKSSLIHAGLLPELMGSGEASGMLVLPIGYVGRGREELPFTNIFVQSVAATLCPELAPEQQGRLSLAEAIAAARKAREPQEDDRSVLLILDQFEEFVTRHRAHWERREGFFKQVAEALAADDDLHVLLVMREDYIADLVPFAHLLPDHLRSRYRMERLGRDAAALAISGPAAMAGCPFEEGLAEALVDELRRFRRAATIELGEYVEPVQLQIVCVQLWNKLPDGSTSITPAHVREHADVDRALIGFYSDVVGRVVEKAPVNERLLRRFFAETLITPSRTRGLVYRGESTTGGLPNRAVDLLNDEYIVRVEVRGSDRWYELAHDRLLEPIRVANEVWNQDYEQRAPLPRRAREWIESGRAPRLLLDAEALWRAEAWLRDEPTELLALTSSEQELLDKSREYQREQLDRRAERRTRLEDLGWGVIFPATGNLGDTRRERRELPADWPSAESVDRIREALGELLGHRREEASRKNPRHYREFTGKDGYRPGDDAQGFLRRHGASFHTAGPDKMPHYLLIVGDPEVIPFEFQYGLDARFSVGRIDFETLHAYASYARSVVTAESRAFSLSRNAVVFNPTPEDDRPSEVARARLVTPLLNQFAAATPSEWTVAPSEGAMKSDLKQLLGGPRTPALLFTASHGVGFPNSDPRQLAHQGALLCNDWPGPARHRGPLGDDLYFAADDVADDARLLGLVVCMFAEYGAGTPQLDNFPIQGTTAKPIAPRAFVSRLCQRLLGHPLGGALAVIGHVERQWTSSFTDDLREREGENEGFKLFFHVLDRMMRGHTVGSAMEILNMRYTELASALVDDLLRGDDANPRKRWNDIIRAIDARNYIILGDPAARLPLDGPAVEERPTIAPISAPVEAPVVQSFIDAEDALLFFNGVHGATGTYAFAPLPLEEVLRLFTGREESQWRPVSF